MCSASTIPAGDLAHAEASGGRLWQWWHVGRDFGQSLAEHLHQPRPALDRARPSGGRLLGNHRAESEKPAATVGRNLFDSPPLRTSHAGDAIVLGEDSVDDHGVGGDHSGNRAVSDQQVFEEPHRLFGQRVAQDRRELREVLQAAAVIANREGIRYFSTTLLYSRYQKHDLARDIGEEIARTYGLKFYYRDFREGWTEGQRKARESGLYRQKYCGCIYSEKDRFFKG